MNKKVDEEFKYIHDEYLLQCICSEMKDKINKAIEKLKEHKYDLDYEPWSIYKIDGFILFDLVRILENKGDIYDKN